MTRAQNNQKWKRLLSLVLCIVMCMAPVISAANVRAVAPETMHATSVALPEENINDTSTKIKRAEEQASGADTYWWGTASQATVKIGDAITGISDRHSVIFDSPIEEGYENKKTSAYFEVDTNWTAFDMGKQDLMFYIELPEAATGLRMKHICADSWGKWPAPAGMKYQYLAADGATWQENVIDENNEIRLTAGFKGYVRLLLNTAVNCESYADATVKLQFFAFRIGAYGGSYGAAKLGGVWFASKGEAYKVSVDGGEAVKLTTAEPQPSTGDETPAWTGDVLTATVPAEESAAVGEDSAWLTWSDKKWGAVPKVTMKAGEAITPIGAQKSVVLDSPKLEGYKSGGEENSYPVFKVSMNNSQLNIAEQDVMFYLELPVGTTSIRLDGISLSGGTMTPAAGNLPYQYLTMDSKTWVDGVTDGNKQIELVDGFKGYVRLRISEANDWWWQGHDSTDASWKTETRPMDNFTFHCARFGGEAGALKFGGVWFVSKEATRYIKVGEGETVRMTTPIDATWITATSVYKETAAVGEASAVTTCTDEGWGRAPKSTSIVGETINILNDGQKSLVIDSEQHEGYHLDDGSERSHGKFDVATDNVTFDMATQELMLYIEMPESAESLRLSNVFFSNGGTLSPYTSDGLTYDYLPIDGNEWVKDQKIDANSQINLPAGFKGYVRIDVTGATGWWWQYHGNSGENDAWKTQTATLTNIRFKLAKFGGGLGAFKLGGIWIVSKEDFTEISVNGADALAMTTYDAPEPVMQATSVAVEADPVSTWDSKVSYTDSDSWKTIDSKAQITLGESITKISDRKSVVIDSEIPEGYHNDGTTTWPLFRVATSATMNADKQDLMFYVELPATMSSLRIQDVTCQGWSFWLAPAGVQFKYLAMDSNDWVDGTITTEGNKQLNLPQGFKGYVRLVLSTAGNYEKLGENAASLKIDALHFRAERFGGELGALKIGGVWFVSKTDTYMVSVDGGEAVKLTNAPDPTPDPDPDPDPEPEPERDYLLATVPNQETADIGADSSLVTMNKKDKFWGIESQATATAAEGINIIDGQKAVIIDSPIEEGFGNSKTSTQYTVSCGWTNLDLKTQDLMFYVEMPATGSGKSSLRIWDLTCDNWSFWVNTRGMQYQYLAIDGSEWVNGAAPLDEDNKQLDLPDGFKGYVRLKIDTAKNVADKETLKVQSFSFYAGTFGGDYGPIKLGGVWFVSKEDYVTIKIGEGEVVKMTKASTPDPDPNPEPERDYLLGSMVKQENGEAGAASTLISINTNDKFWGIESQATATAAEGITIIGEQKSVTIDSPIEEGFGNSQTSPLFAVDCGWTNLNLKTQDLMFYIEMPATGSGKSSLRIWDLTCDSWSFWVNTRGMQYQYLAIDGSAWVNGAAPLDENNKQLDLPDGFKGYVRLKIDTAKNVADKETLKVQSFSFYAGTFGGDYGPMKIGGVWFISKEDYITIQVDDGEVVKMTKASTPDPDPGPDPDDRDYLIATMPNAEEAENGEKSTLVTSNDNDKWWGKDSQSTAVAGEPITIIGNQKSVIIDSPIEEGYGNKQTSTLYTVSCGWKNLDTTTQDIMFYVELPEASSGLRIWDFTCNNWSFWIAPGGMKYQYLEMDSNKWQNGAITNEGNKQLDLPAGFKGYVRLQINTAGNVDVFPATTLQIQSFSFRGDTFGGDYGPIKIGGVWFVSKEKYIKIKVDNGEVLKMTNASDPGPVDPVDPVDPADPDDPNRDYIIGSIPARETAANDKTSRLVTMDDGSKWWGIPTQSTLVAGDPITIIGDQKSVIIDSPILEGYENKRTSALYMVNCGWTDLDLKTQDVMFYIEMPTSGRGSSGLRLWDLACDSYTFWVNTRGMKYQYLSMDSKEWVDGQIGTDDNKQIDLPDGFKGYVRLKVDTAANTADKETLKIQTFSFRPGTFGAEYGPIKFGGVWFVTKENFCYIRVDGAAKKVMTTYWQHNDELLDEFHELIEKLTDKDLSAAPMVDRLQSLYESMSEEYRGKVTQEELDKLNEYAAVIEAYRPEFIGATLKKYGSKPQSAKIGWTVDEALAKKGGYKVVSSGAVMLFGRNYDGKSLIDETTPASVTMTGKTASGYYYATTDIEAGDYKQAMLLRCYVVYEDSKTGKQYTVWCGMYTDKSGQTTPYMKCSLYEVAAYFGVPLYAN